MSLAHVFDITRETLNTNTREDGAEENPIGFFLCGVDITLWATVRNAYRERPTLKMTPPYQISKFWYIGGILVKEASL